MRRAKDSPTRITSRTYLKGYAYRRGDACVFRLRDVTMTLDRRWPETQESRAEIAALLDDWLPTAQYGGRGAAIAVATDAEAPLTVDGLLVHWIAGPGAAASPHVHRHMLGAIAMLPKGLRLDVAALVPVLARAQQTTTLAASTANKRMKMLKRLFAWGVDMGWIARNPVALVGVKAVPKKADVGIFTEDEARRLAWYFVERDMTRPPSPGLRRAHSFAPYAWLVLWQFYTGMRISETLALRWRDVFDDEIRILDSKGHDVRYFPVAAFPEVAELVGELREARSGSRDDARVFHWWSDENGGVTIGAQLRDAMTALEMRGGVKRTLHSFRASAELWMENVVGLSPSLVVQITGHSLAVHEKHYRSRRRGKDLARQIDRERS